MSKDVAFEKLEKECEAAKNRRDYVEIMEYLRERIRADESVADRVLRGEKTIDGAYKEMQSAARKQAKHGCYCMTSAEAWEIVDKYYGIAAEESAKSQTSGNAGNVVSIFDLI